VETPDDTWIVGGDVDRVSLTLRITAPDLDPDAITRRLGVPPSFAARRGDERRSKGGNIKQPVGIWSVGLPNSQEWVLADAIGALLDRLPADVAIWKEIGSSARIDVFCGLHLDDWNRGLELPPDLLARLGERRITLGFDIYCGGSDDEADA
jgi:hypothetical protein